MQATLTQPTPHTSPEMAAREAVQNYLDGAAGAQGVLTRTFYSSCNLHSLDDEGRLELVPLERFVDFAEAGSLPAHEAYIVSLDVIHTMARAHVVFQFPTFRFEDYLTLFRINGSWRIVSKAYIKLEGAR